jgi:hypothetical protein
MTTQGFIDLVKKLNAENTDTDKKFNYLTSFYRDQITFGDFVLYDSHLNELKKESVEEFVRVNLNELNEK